MPETIFLILLISVNNDFRIGVRLKPVSKIFQPASQLSKIVNFAIKNHPYLPILIRQGLVSCSQIDDAQSTMPEEDERASLIYGANVFPGIIGASMNEAFTHFPQDSIIRNILGHRGKKSYDPAHITMSTTS
jgi:hypothetical protein